jgi:cysteine desulfurase/selenocysteine lyase
MVGTVNMEGSTYAPIPHKYEAGTMPIAEAVGLGAAVDYLTSLGMENVAAHEHELVEYAVARLKTVEGLKLVGPQTAEAHGAAISFVLEAEGLGEIHPHDVGQVLDEQGIAVRVGQHCARPVCVRYGIPATTRASFSVYTTKAEIDALVEGLEYVKRFFGA